MTALAERDAVRLSFPIADEFLAWGLALVLREVPRPTRPRGRIPRVAAWPWRTKELLAA